MTYVWHRACQGSGVNRISKVNQTRQSESLRILYRRRERLVLAIAALEQLQNLRLQRAEPAILALLAVDRDRATPEKRVRLKRAA